MNATHTLRLKRLGVDTQQEFIVYMRSDCHICKSEGFQALTRIQVMLGDRTVIATLNIITTDLLHHNEASLSESAWQRLGAQEGNEITLSHLAPIESLSRVRAKIYGEPLNDLSAQAIIQDIAAEKYSNVHIASFVTACADDNLQLDEIIALTKAMITAGERLTWPKTPIMDKHCVGGLPGNRTTLLLVPIIAAFGLTIPKTSSRAITSPAGTADTMETLAPVTLDIPTIRRVVDKEGGCIVWGGAIALSPADDILIRVERVLDLDSDGQLIASVLSKKGAAGSTHVVIDIPVGPTAKVRSADAAERLRQTLATVGTAVGLSVSTVITDGRQPVGRGIGPALEAWDVLAVLQNHPDAPRDLRERALALAAALLELSQKVPVGSGYATATAILDDGRAWKKFMAICAAQGGLREPGRAPYTHTVTAPCAGVIDSVDNRRLARVAKLAGAAGLVFHTPIGSTVEKDQPLYTIHAGARGELDYTLAYVASQPDMIGVRL